MKTKIFFFLATMMLCCASAFAQSGNNEPLQGDVNEDGIVDVADIAAIIEIIKDQGGEIYYFSAGAEEVTTSNYTSANNVQTVTNINDIPNSLDISSISRKEAYFVLPNGCTLTVKTSANLPVTILTVATVNSHTIYKTDGKIGSGSTCTISKN